MARDEPVNMNGVLASRRVSLLGEINQQLVETFLGRLGDLADEDGDIAIEVTTPGGDAEMARRIVLEIDLLRAGRRGRVLFLGKTMVYSAGTTIMSAFPRADRYLASDAMLMIHCRQLEKTLEIDGPIRASLPKVESLCRQIEAGIAIEEESFRRLVEGSAVTLEELDARALYNWYLPAAEALRLGLVSAVLDIDDLQPGGRGSRSAFPFKPGRFERNEQT